MFHSGYLLQGQILQKRTHTRLYWVWCFVYSAHRPTLLMRIYSCIIAHMIKNESALTKPLIIQLSKDHPKPNLYYFSVCNVSVHQH